MANRLSPRRRKGGSTTAICWRVPPELFDPATALREVLSSAGTVPHAYFEQTKGKVREVFERPPRTLRWSGRATQKQGEEYEINPLGTTKQPFPPFVTFRPLVGNLLGIIDGPLQQSRLFHEADRKCLCLPKDAIQRINGVAKRRKSAPTGAVRECPGTSTL